MLENLWKKTNVALVYKKMTDNRKLWSDSVTTNLR